MAPGVGYRGASEVDTAWDICISRFLYNYSTSIKHTAAIRGALIWISISLCEYMRFALPTRRVSSTIPANFIYPSVACSRSAQSFDAVVRARLSNIGTTTCIAIILFTLFRIFSSNIRKINLLLAANSCPKIFLVYSYSISVRYSL